MIPLDALGFILVSDCPDPATASTMPDAGGWPYRGIWHAPAPADAQVHLFAAADVYPDALLAEAGWTRDEAVPHVEAVDADTTAAVLAIVDGPAHDTAGVEPEGDAPTKPAWHRGCSWCWRTIWHGTARADGTTELEGDA